MMATTAGRCAGWVVGLVALLGAGIASAGELWTENAQEALAQAAKEKKDVLIDFTGSDWCGWCKKLDAEVFSQPGFQAEAPKYFVFLKLDFPHQRPLSAETKKQNAEWQQKLAIQGYPTIVLADAAGQPYAKTGHQAGGAEGYLKHLAELRQLRAKRDDLFAKAQAAQGIERAKALDQALQALDPSFLGCYSDVAQEIVKLDADGKAGLKVKYEAMLLVQKIGAAMQAQKLDEAIALADEAIKGLNGKGQAAQDILFMKSFAQFRKQDKAAAKRSLQEAIQAAPGTPKAAQIQQILERAFKE